MARKSDNMSIPGFLEDYKYIGKGSECQVFEIVKRKLVCKVYYSHNDAKYNYVLQRIGYRAGIAPEPLALENNYYFSRYIVAWDMAEETEGKLFYQIKDKIKYRNFLKKVKKIFGGKWSDDHSGNVAEMKVKGKKRYVIIDFGVAGFEKTVLGGILSRRLNVYWNGGHLPI